MYTDLNIAFNDNTYEIDKMARDMHVKKTNLLNSVHDDYNKQQMKWDNDIKEYNTGKMHHNNLFLDSKNVDNFDNFDSISIDSPELDSIIDSGKFKQNPISKYVNNNNKCKKMKKDEDIFLHIKNCFDCREKLIKFLRSNNRNNNRNNNPKHKSKYNIDGVNDVNDVNGVKYDKIYGELIIIAVIGIIIIIILDFLMKSVVPNSIR